MGSFATLIRRSRGGLQHGEEQQRRGPQQQGPHRDARGECAAEDRTGKKKYPQTTQQGSAPPMGVASTLGLGDGRAQDSLGEVLGEIV